MQTSLSQITVGIIHTFASDCCCHEAVIETCRRFDMNYWLADSETLPAAPPVCDVIFDTSERYAGYENLRWRVRTWAEEHSIKVAGDSAAVMRLCDDKAAARQVLQNAGIPVPPGFALDDVPDAALAASLLRLYNFHLPVVIKSAGTHGSLGLAIASRTEDIATAVQDCLAAGKSRVLVEEYIEGPELQLPVFLCPPMFELPVMEVAGLSGVYSLEMKAESEGDVRYLPAKISAEQEHKIRSLGALACSALGIGSYTRFDLRVREDGSIYFLEANITPSLERGFCLDRALCAAGRDLTDAVYCLLQQALLRK